MFITFEGPEGSGKTTQIKKTYNELTALGYNVLMVREPGGTLIGSQIREILLGNSENKNMYAKTELLLFCASRAQLVHETIRPHLKQGGVILCDRYTWSTLAYQGYGHGLDIPTLYSIIDFATEKLIPNVIVYLDIDPEEGLMRRMKGKSSGEEWNRIDSLSLLFHIRVYEGYQKLINNALNSRESCVVKIDASKDVDCVAALVSDDLEAIIPKSPAQNKWLRPECLQKY